MPMAQKTLSFFMMILVTYKIYGSIGVTI